MLQFCPIIGVVTRTDLIRIFLDDASAKLPSPRQNTVRKKNISKLMFQQLPKPCLELLKLVGKLASSYAINIFVVGGFVRDLLMNNEKMSWPNLDIDLVVEGDAKSFAKNLAQILNGRVREHSEFLTALVIFNSSALAENSACEYLDKNYVAQKKNSKISPSLKFSDKEQNSAENDYEIRVDIATARLEYYQRPAALPTVELSSIRMDLTRRDFSINAMAIQLNNEYFGELVDFFDGQVDIKQKRIRMLHALSFVEDPTRTIRAIRFEQRYNFKLGAHCERLIKHSIELGLIDKLSGKRVLSELNLILKEQEPLKCLLRLQEFDLLKAIHPMLEINSKEKNEFFTEAYKTLQWYKMLYIEERVDYFFFYILLVCRNASINDIYSLFDRLEIYGHKKKEIVQARSNIIQSIPLLEKWYESSMPMSELHNILHAMNVESLLFLVVRAPAIVGEDLKKQLSFYMYKARLETLSITGKDILNLGIKKGPLIGIILKEVLQAKMNDEISGFDQEIDYAEQRVNFYLKNIE